MTDCAKQNAKIAQEFWNEVEDGADPIKLWADKITIDGELDKGGFCLFDFALETKKIKWKPETIIIHGCEVPKPMTEFPSDSDKYWYHRLGNGIELMNCIWNDDNFDRYYFENGIFNNREDCRKFAEAYYRPWSEIAE